MNFSVAHLICNIDLPGYEALYFDEPFNIAMCQAVHLRRQLIVRTVDGTKLHRAVRVGPDRDIPKPVAKILGAARIEYTEYIDYDLGAYAGRWRTVSSVLTDKVQSAGTFRFEARDQGVMRIVEGEVQIKIFGLGGLVERFIAADIEQSYAAAAVYTNQITSAQPAAP